MFCRKIKKTIQPQYELMSPVLLKQLLKQQPMICFYRQKTDMQLKDKVVIVTGAGTGIGASTARAFAEEGSHVVISDINQENVKKVAKQCKEEFCAKVLALKTDVSKDSDLETMVCKTIEKFGQIDVVVNNAGILTFGSILKPGLMEAYEKTMSINFRGCMYLTILTAPYLVKTRGNVINISSILGRTYSGNSTYMPYCITKAALDHFMFGAALELISHGVRVNNVCPGPTKTEIFGKAGVKGSWKEIGESFKVPEVSEPEEIADLIVYLASNRARSITGVKYYIDRGNLLRNH